MQKLRVITVNNRPDLYPPIYDEMIALGIKKHLSLPHEHLHISSENGDSWFYIELVKMQPFLFIAIDSIIIGSLDECVNMGKLTAIREWKRASEPNTSLMWVENAEYLLDIPIDKKKYTWENHAEQRFLEEHADLSFYPMEWTPSYKYALDGTSTPITDKAKVVVFHGQPKPHQIGWKL